MEVAPVESADESPCNEFISVWSMFVYNTCSFECVENIFDRNGAREKNQLKECNP